MYFTWTTTTWKWTTNTSTHSRYRKDIFTPLVLDVFYIKFANWSLCLTIMTINGSLNGTLKTKNKNLVMLLPPFRVYAIRQNMLSYCIKKQIKKTDKNLKNEKKTFACKYVVKNSTRVRILHNAKFKHISSKLDLLFYFQK